MRAASIVVPIILGVSAIAGQAPSPPGPPATASLAEYVRVFNSGDSEAMREFVQSRYADSALRQTTLDDRVNRYPVAKARLKSLEVIRILAERPRDTYALAKAGNGEHFVIRTSVEATPPHRLLFVFLEPAEDLENIVIPDPRKDNTELTSSIRAYLADRVRADEFAGVVLVARNSEVAFLAAYGYQNLEKKAPNRVDTRFNLGSINKSFTQVAILQLERQGKLALQDRVGKFLPDYPNRQVAEKVTIRHLLDMTSGIGDFFGTRYDSTPKERIRSIEDYLPLFADRPLEFEPGTNNRYSNGGFIVLGAIIEKVSGRSYYDYVRDNIFKPVGMLDTDSYERDKDVPNRALGYTRPSGPGRDRVVNDASLPARGSSAGGGYSTAGDMLKYVEALRTGRIFLPDVGNGLAIAGGAPGINAALEWDPRKGYVVIVLSNFDPPAAGRVARQIVAWLPE